MSEVRRPQPTTAGRGDVAPGDAALDGLIRQYLPVVYSAERRQLGGDAALAEDVTQAVFLVFATFFSNRQAPVRSG